jgi:hypothetical protein
MSEVRQEGSVRPGRRRRPGGWWRRNAAALVALALLVPATFGIISSNEASTNATRAQIVPIEVEWGQTYDYAGTTWGPATVEELPVTDEHDIPQDARLIEVTIPVVPGDEEPGCFPPTLLETGGEQRQWDQSGILLGWNTTSCALMGTEPFDIVAPFVLPPDAEGPFVVDLELVADAPAILRLPVGD